MGPPVPQILGSGARYFSGTFFHHFCDWRSDMLEPSLTSGSKPSFSVQKGVREFFFVWSKFSQVNAQVHLVYKTTVERTCFFVRMWDRGGTARIIHRRLGVVTPYTNELSDIVFPPRLLERRAHAVVWIGQRHLGSEELRVFSVFEAHAHVFERGRHPPHRLLQTVEHCRAPVIR